MAAGGLARGNRSGIYRKRKPLPAIIIVALLLVAAVVVWFKVINKDSNVNVAVACPPSTVATGAAAGQALPYNALDSVTPAAPGQVQVRVLNASAQRGQAQTVSTQLLGLGFQQAASPADDPLYPKQNMTCVGQIRFGANGQAEARTLSLVLPCTQLIRDNRQDTTVDLAVGKDFIAVAPNASATSALQQLTAWANAHPAPQGGQQAQGGLQPQLSPTLLAGAHNIAC